MNYAQEIKNIVKMPQMVRFYGFKPNNQNRMPCPFHNGTNPNLGIKEDFCHCFKCGYKGDVIKFVQDFFGISFQEALLKLNEDFALCLPIGEKKEKRKIIADAKAEFIRRRSLEQRQEAASNARTHFYDAVGEFHRLEKNFSDYAPNGPEEFHPLFVEALQKMEAAKYNIFCAEEDWKNELEKSSD